MTLHSVTQFSIATWSSSMNNKIKATKKLWKRLRKMFMTNEKIHLKNKNKLFLTPHQIFFVFISSINKSALMRQMFPYNTLILNTPRWYLCVIYLNLNLPRLTVNYLRDSFSDVIFGAWRQIFDFFNSFSSLEDFFFFLFGQEDRTIHKASSYLDIYRCEKKS